MKKYNYYVAVIEWENSNGIAYVTKVDNITKQAWWRKGEDALAMSKTAAENILFGLTANGYRAMVCQVPAFIELKNN